MILSDFMKALAQMRDRRFLRVVMIGVALAFALLVAVYAGFLTFLESLVPQQVEIPLVGPVGGLDTLLTIGSLFFMLVLSIFLMVPVASAFTGFFLDDVAQAVEDKHYPNLPPAPRIPLMDNVKDSLSFFGLLIVVNLFSLVLFGFAGPLIPVAFWAINGYLLGREYFTMVAMRRIGRTSARIMRRQHRASIWVAGTLMAAPLSIPLINLFIPVLGAATFTHLFHRLNHSPRR